MATTALSVDVLTASERVMVVESLTLRISQVRRQINAEKDVSVAEIRNRQLASLEALVSKFR